MTSKHLQQLRTASANARTERMNKLTPTAKTTSEPTDNDMSIRPICGHPYITKLTPGMTVEDITFLKSGFCPECAEREAEFEEMAEAEYQLQKAWDALQATPSYVEMQAVQFIQE